MRLCGIDPPRNAVRGRCSHFSEDEPAQVSLVQTAAAYYNKGKPCSLQQQGRMTNANQQLEIRQEEGGLMRAILVMFDSLRRDLLPNYGADCVPLPNFARLA